MKIKRKIQFSQQLITDILSINNNIIIEELNQITEEIFEIILYIDDIELKNNLNESLNSIFVINNICMKSLSKKKHLLNNVYSIRNNNYTEEELING